MEVNGDHQLFGCRLQNIFFCVQQQKEIRTGLRVKPFYFWVNYPFKLIDLLNDRVTLKTGIMIAENSALPSHTHTHTILHNFITGINFLFFLFIQIGNSSKIDISLLNIHKLCTVSTRNVLYIHYILYVYYILILYLNSENLTHVQYV